MSATADVGILKNYFSQLWLTVIQLTPASYPIQDTNIAETSCTINGLDATVDFGIEKIASRGGLTKGWY